MKKKTRCCTLTPSEACMWSTGSQMSYTHAGGDQGLPFSPQFCPALGKANHSLANLLFATKANGTSFTTNRTLSYQRQSEILRLQRSPWRRAADMCGSDLTLPNDSTPNDCKNPNACYSAARRSNCLHWLKNSPGKQEVQPPTCFLIPNNLWSQTAFVLPNEYSILIAGHCTAIIQILLDLGAIQRIIEALFPLNNPPKCCHRGKRFSMRSLS